ncbi:MAG: CBS domain-containing protein [Pseudonocardiaceae bacterium]|nr:CBS domain-containing protein [Pseudonocardiaceae bacterium]
MTAAREIMTPDPAYVRSSDSVREAVGKIADRGIGSVPVIGEDNRVKGMITDRDIVVRVLAEGKDPHAMHASELIQGDGTVVTVSVDEDIADLMRKMTTNRVRRLPVTDGDKLVGIVAQADVAKAMDNPNAGELVDAISTDSTG